MSGDMCGGQDGGGEVLQPAMWLSTPPPLRPGCPEPRQGMTQSTLGRAAPVSSLFPPPRRVSLGDPCRWDPLVLLWSCVVFQPVSMLPLLSWPPTEGHRGLFPNCRLWW